jgi:hypothetical protein
MPYPRTLISGVLMRVLAAVSRTLTAQLAIDLASLRPDLLGNVPLSRLFCWYRGAPQGPKSAREHSSPDWLVGNFPVALRLVCGHQFDQELIL